MCLPTLQYADLLYHGYHCSKAVLLFVIYSRDNNILLLAYRIFIISITNNVIVINFKDKMFNCFLRYLNIFYNNSFLSSKMSRRQLSLHNQLPRLAPA